MQKSIVTYGVGITTAVALIYLKEFAALSTGILAALSVVLLFMNRDRGGVFLYISILLLAMPFEMLFVHFGVWTYPYPNVLGVPLWAPFLWINVAFVFRHVRDSFAGNSKAHRL